MIERKIPNVALARVVPPKEWRPRAGNYDDAAHFTIPSPIEQVGNHAILRISLIVSIALFQRV